MERTDHNEVILESLLKLGTIVPVQQVARGINTRKMLAAQGEKRRLSDLLISQGNLAEERAERLRNIEEIIPGYTLWEKIGEGKLGIVYKARQKSLDRWVAIKVLKPELAQQPYIGRFLREIHALGKLDHPNILRALDSGDIDGLHYLITEYFDGVTLAQYVSLNGKMAEDKSLEMGEKIASALEHIWSKGMVHRDIVPENIMLAGANVKLCDMGLVRAISGDTMLTPYPIPRRSYSYIPPEQIQGKTLDFRSDVYSLGAVLYFAITGHHVVENWDCELEDACIKAPEHPKYHVSEISEDASALIMRLLSFAPKRRWGSKQGISREIKRVGSQKGLKASFFTLERVAWALVAVLFCYVVFAGAKGGSLAKRIFARCAPSVVVIESGDILGSGVIISRGGKNWIVTNAHLLRKMQKLRVKLKDGREFWTKAKCIAESMDLALIAIPSGLQGISAIPIASGDMQVGDDVFVIGHPKGYCWSLSTGTISGIRKDTIQTDAAINVGNSGGPVLNRDGQMLGITTYTIGKSNPIGFAISNKRIEKFLRTLSE